MNVVVRLLHLLEKVVSATEGFPVEKIEKLYSSMNQCISSHRACYDRAEMIHVSTSGFIYYHSSYCNI